MVTKQEFAQSIKAKYPQYANVDDNILTEKMLAKYPQYAEKIDIESQFTPEQELRIESERKKEASIPSKLVRSGVGLLGIKVKPYSKMLEEEYQGGQNALKQLAKTTGKIGVQLAPLAVPMGGGILPQAGKAALAYGASKTGEKLLEGKKPTEALKEGLKSGAGAGAFTGAFGLAGKAGQALAKTKLGQSTIKGLKAGASGAGEFLTGVPKELYEHALNKPEILKGKTSKDIIKREYEHAGKLAQNTILKLKQESSKLLNQEKQALKGSGNVKYSIKDIIDSIDNIKAQNKFDGIQTLDKSDLLQINKIKNQLVKLENKGGITPGQMHAVKTNIDKLVTYDPQTIKKVSTVGEKSLKEIRHNLNQRLRASSEGYAKANDKFASLAKIQERLKTHLKDERVANALKNLDQKDETTIGLFKELDALAPKGRKFLEKVKDTKTREAFNELIPGKGYTTGGTQGVGNIARAGILGALYRSPLTAGAVATTFSPVVHRGAIKAASNIPKLADITKKAVPYYMNRKGENK